MSLVARHLEASGIPTVIIGSALDIVEHCGVPRFVFSDFPLGNPCGHPWDKDMQTEIVRLALRVLETATAPRTTVRSPFAWKAEDPEWRERYNRVRPRTGRGCSPLGMQGAAASARHRGKDANFD